MSKILLKNVRLSFPSLYETEIYNGEDTEKYAATFLISKSDTATIKKIKATIKSFAEDNFGKPIPKTVKTPLQDGDEKEYDGYADHFSMKAATKKRPVLVDRSKTPVAEDDNVFYAGCYVNASLSLWAMDNKYGKRVLVNLNGVQFFKDGEPFGAENDSLDDFEELESQDAEDDDDDPFA